MADLAGVSRGLARGNARLVLSPDNPFLRFLKTAPGVVGH